MGILMEKNTLGYLLKYAQYTLRQNLDEALRMVGLTTPQFSAMRELALEPNLSNAELARACFVTPQTMIKILQGLQKAGLITRQPHLNNKHILDTALTPAGLQKLEAATTLVDSIEDRMRMGVTIEEQELLRKVFARFIMNLAKSPDSKKH
jgi:DNA-binding MarR family transcriptional regulator